MNDISKLPRNHPLRLAAMREEQALRLSPDYVKTLVIQKTQERLDSFAMTRGYDGILSACTYATSKVPQFASEAQACVNLRDATWSKLYLILEEVKLGVRPMPPSFTAIEADLPVPEWGV